MGAHLGYGGRVVGESLRCPFHGFCFDAEGRCVSTGYGTRPPARAKARAWEVREAYDLVFAYHSEAGAAPAWPLPALDTDGWSVLRGDLRRLRGHPQETSENSADIGHLMVVHGYGDIELRALDIAGPHFNPRVAFTHPGGILRFSRAVRALGAKALSVRAEIDIHVWGLGFSYVDVSLPGLGLKTRQFVLATPTDAYELELRYGMRIRDIADAAALGAVGRGLQRLVIDGLLSRMAMRAFRHDVGQDLPIWSHKKFVHPPALAEGDGPIGKFRTWARQFYPEPAVAS
jgi:hypothetical protein